jgi:hypothetical protein
MKAVLMIAGLLILASCGVDGEPTPPSKAQSTPGVSVSGEVGIGVAGSL